MGLSELVADAKMRIQRRWPTMMLVEKTMNLSIPSPSGPPQVVKEFRVVAAQDIDAGFQLLCIVAENFGSVNEHTVIANSSEEILKLDDGLRILSGSAFDPHKQYVSSDCLVTGRVLYIFTDVLIVPIAEVQKAFEGSTLTPMVRDRAYWQAHDESRPPELFICHDSADKVKFVRPLVEALNSKLVKVWYDEQSLRPGNSLIDSIEKGLQAARYAILVLSPSFLANKRWAAREFRSLVTRDIADERRILIPIWLGVGREEVARYSLELSDRMAVVVSDTSSPADVSEQLIRTLRLTTPDLGVRFS